MAKDGGLLTQLMQGMPPQPRHQMLVIRLVAERDECALGIIRRIESGRFSPTDAPDALDA